MKAFRLLLVSCIAYGVTGAVAAERPNIVFILSDDLGYGDIQAYNPDSKIPTPNLDRMAAEGCDLRMPTRVAPLVSLRATRFFRVSLPFVC